MSYWPHAPMHKCTQTGMYIVTAGTYLKKHVINTPEKLSLVQNKLFEIANEFGWQLQAWAIMSNHYHFIARSPEDPSSLKKFVSTLHRVTATEFNKIDGTSQRRVWYNCWDTHLSFQKSYLARLNYVNQNPVKHGVVKNAKDYPWCSASWFENTTPRSFRQSIERFKIDSVNVSDNF